MSDSRFEFSEHDFNTEELDRIQNELEKRGLTNHQLRKDVNSLMSTVSSLEHAISVLQTSINTLISEQEGK